VTECWLTTEVQFSLCLSHNSCGHLQLTVELLEHEAAASLDLEQRSRVSGALYPLSLLAFTELCLVSMPLPVYLKTSITGPTYLSLPYLSI
jgi:hypothetical protein